MGLSRRHKHREYEAFPLISLASPGGRIDDTMMRRRPPIHEFSGGHNG